MEMQPARPRWREALVVLALSVLLPGAGHVYVRWWRRGMLWSLLSLAVVFPAAMFAYVVASSFSPRALSWILGCWSLFGLLCGLRPAWAVLRRRSGRLEDPVYAARPPAGWVIGTYVAIGLLAAATEAAGFLGTCLGVATVQSSALEPLVHPGDDLTLLLSTYVRPVHGEIVLFRAPDTAGGSGPRFRLLLGRVLATGRDRIEARDGKLLVNAVELNPERIDQRRLLEKAGRREKRRRFFHSFISRLLPGSTGEGECAQGEILHWSDGNWGPRTLPRDVYLLLPDEKPEDKSAAACGILVGKAEVLGRRIF